MVLGLYERDRAIAGSVISSAIAFRLFLFFVPLLLLVIGIASQVAQVVDADAALDAGGIGETLRQQIRTALDQPGHTRWIAIGLGLIGTVTSGRTLCKTAVAASALAWQLPVRAVAPTRVVGSLIGLIATMGMVAAVINRIRVELGLPVVGASFAVALCIYALSWLFVFALLPRAANESGAFGVASLLPGALLVAVVTVVLQMVSQIYLPQKIAQASDLYGAFGTTVVMLGWLFALGRAIVVGMTLNAVVHDRFGSIPALLADRRPLRSLSRQERRE